jgi:hypothetical protein
VFLFGVIGVDAGKPSKYPSIQVSKYPSIQVSKYPGAEFDPRAVPDSHDAVCCADPHVQILWAPLWTAPGFPSGACRIPSWGRSRSSMQDEGLGGLPDHLPLGDVLGVTIRVPYMKRVIGSLRVAL